MRTIVVGIDGAEASVDAVRWAAEWMLPDDRICLVHATGRQPFLSPDLRARFAAVTAPVALERLACAENALSQSPVHSALWEVRAGEAADVLLQVADELDADAIIIGHHQEGWLGRLLSGKLASTLIGQGHCTVIVAR